MAHAQKPDFVFRRNGRFHLNRRGLQFSQLLAAEVCATAVVMLNTPCSEVVWRVLATQFIHQFPLHRVSSHFNWSLHVGMKMLHIRWADSRINDNAVAGANQGLRVTSNKDLSRNNLGKTLEHRPQPTANIIKERWVKDTEAPWPPATR